MDSLIEDNVEVCRMVFTTPVGQCPRSGRGKSRGNIEKVKSTENTENVNQMFPLAHKARKAFAF